MEPTFLEKLFAALEAGELTLPGLLFDELSKRGPLPPAEHSAELAWIEQMREQGRIKPGFARAATQRLRILQGAASHGDEHAGAAVADAPPRAVLAAAGVDDDATVLQPASRAARPPATEDATVVKPASARPGPDSPGSVTGTTGSGTTGSATNTSSSFNAASWQRVANAEGGDYAAAGTLLKGRFYLEREIGRGGMGVVFLARDERKVEARDRDPYLAVKVLNDEFRRHPDSLIALQRESRRSQSLAHDNIVRVYDFDKDRTIVFMTMEYIDGSDLKTLIRERAYNGLPLSEARQLIEGMAWALKRAHAAGVVHSDFKPGNVMVTRDGVPKVFDFGIARAGKHMGDAVGEQTVFDAGTLGALTPAYASLEMIQGKEPTPSDDIYALGCVVFELLTGKHPFDKVSAEVAMKEGRKPPPVPGLTRRQYQTLCDAVAFTGDRRLKSASALLEGLRHVSLRERAGPYLIAGAVAAVLLGLGGWGASRYLHSRHLAQVIARFAMSSPGHYLNEDEAVGALGTLDEDEQKRIVLDQGDLIQAFLLARIDAYWNPAAKRYDYARAQHVFELRDQLKLYSPKLDLKRTEMEEEKNTLLNQLDTQLSQRIEAGAIFPDQPDNAVAILDTIRAIDPSSSLLKNAELELKYDTAIAQSLSANRVDEAGRRLAQASEVFPDSPHLARRKAQLDALQTSTGAAPVVAHSGTQGVAEARRTLAALIAAPSLAAPWRAGVSEAMATLGHDDAPQTRQLVQALANAIAGKVAGQLDPLQLPQASSLVDLGLTYAPGSQLLQAQRTRLDRLQQQLQAKLDQESAAAEVAAKIESMKRAAAANDIAKAQVALQRIRELQPDNAFARAQGPVLLAQAYLGQARDSFEHGRYQAAVDTLAHGIQALGDRTDLRAARERYALVGAIENARNKPMSAAELASLRGRLDQVRRTDAHALAELESEMKLHGQLPQGNLAALLDSLAAGPQAARAGAERAPVAAAHEASPGVPSATQPAPTTQPASTIRPGAGTTAGATKPVTAVASHTPAAAENGQAAPADDPCGSPDLVGQGRFCADRVAGRRGPTLVVVPGVSGGKPYALSRAEISQSEFNKFCAATHQCSAKALEDRMAGSLPVTDIPLDQAKAYAAWLTKASGGYVYRLPTDAEWLHAAQAGGRWKQAPDSNCVPPGASGDDGSGAPISSLGRGPSPWGLVNLTGNVWEWVVSGGQTAVRGGSFTSYWSDCTVESHRADNGAAQNDVGLRVLRELK